MLSVIALGVASIAAALSALFVVWLGIGIGAGVAASGLSGLVAELYGRGEACMSS